MRSLHSPSCLVVTADDDHAVANAGLVLSAVLVERLGIEALADALVAWVIDRARRVRDARS
jgi:hypothetical protein